MPGSWTKLRSPIVELDRQVSLFVCFTLPHDWGPKYLLRDKFSLFVKFHQDNSPTNSISMTTDLELPQSIASRNIRYDPGNIMNDDVSLRPCLHALPITRIV
ncbi:hypothetical protein N7G274_006245 [Stereocaulon virgatum]|uniref:Uncharacterized protein n=1 Tax=Stereocaulon virgatum TaxID=373712 RepID=A0ABR4A8R5_9LECA